MRVLQANPVVLIFAVLALCCNFYLLFPSFQWDTLPPAQAEVRVETVLKPSPSISTSISDKRSILFVHFHKSGGTDVCRSVEHTMNITTKEGLPVERKLNCNSPHTGPNANPIKFGHFQTCEHLLPYALNSVNFVAVEVPFQDSMPCENISFRTFAIMRDPVARLQSHMLVHHFSPERIRNIIQQRKPCPSDYFMDGYPIVNSMVTRQLLGRERFVDVTPVNQNDLHKAKTIVDSFDAFVPLEHLNHSNVQELLKKTVPEYVQGQRVMMKQSKRPTQKRRSYSPTREFLELITEENKYDILLYQYMLEKLGIQ